MNTRRCPLCSYAVHMMSEEVFFCDVCERQFSFRLHGPAWVTVFFETVERFNAWVTAHMLGGWTVAGDNRAPFLRLVRVAKLDDHWRSYLERRQVTRGRRVSRR